MHFDKNQWLDTFYSDPPSIAVYEEIDMKYKLNYGLLPHFITSLLVLLVIGYLIFLTETGTYPFHFSFVLGCAGLAALTNTYNSFLLSISAEFVEPETVTVEENEDG